MGRLDYSKTKTLLREQALQGFQKMDVRNLSYEPVITARFFRYFDFQRAISLVVCWCIRLRFCSEMDSSKYDIQKVTREKVRSFSSLYGNWIFYAFALSILPYGKK